MQGPLQNHDRYIEPVELFDVHPLEYKRRFRAIDTLTNTQVHIKMLRQDAPERRRHRLMEAAIRMRNLVHPNGISFVQFFSVPGYICLAIDFVDGVPLDQIWNLDFLQPRQLQVSYRRLNGGAPIQVPVNGFGLPENFLVQIISDVAEYLVDLHRQDVAYRGLKPSHILLEGGQNGDGRARVLDMTLARSNSAMCETFIDSARYTAPEMLMGHYDGKMVDSFGLGAVAYYCLVGQPPFNFELDHQQYEAFLFGHEMSILGGDISEDCRTVINGLLRHPHHAVLAQDGRWTMDMVLSNGWVRAGRRHRPMASDNPERKQTEAEIRAVMEEAD